MSHFEARKPCAPSPSGHPKGNRSLLGRIVRIQFADAVLAATRMLRLVQRLIGRPQEIRGLEPGSAHTDAHTLGGTVTLGVTWWLPSSAVMIF